MPTAVVGVGFLPPFVCVSVFLHDISKNDAVSVIRRGTEMFQDESWKLIYAGIKRSKFNVTNHKKTLLVWIFALL